jgi:hypothetical protein
MFVTGRLRRPYRPFQVIGVLVAVLPIAGTSLITAERAGTRSVPAKPNLAEAGERLDARTIPSVS